MLCAPSRRRSLSSTKSLNPQMSGEEEDSDLASKLGMCNREIVRRGALILFCDYVVSAGAREGGGPGGCQAGGSGQAASGQMDRPVPAEVQN